jgi:dipeptidase E
MKFELNCAFDCDMCKLLLLSNSTMPGTGFFSWPRPHVANFLGKERRMVAFIPFAAVSLSFDKYFSAVSEAFESMGYEVRSVHQTGDKKQLIRESDAIVVGGGNTFALLSRMYEHDLLADVQERVSGGVPYIGWSAGANLACPTIKTTNDMPVVQPPSFRALDLIPFQINPHYHELKFQNQGGETRKERIEEFIAINPDTNVIGLPEGMLVLRNEDSLRLEGAGTAKLYQSGKAVSDLGGAADITFLLRQ